MKPYRGVVYTATSRNIKDLILGFNEELKALEKENPNNLHRLFVEKVETETPLIEDQKVLELFLEIMIYTLNTYAEEDYYFGESPEDENIFGFWPIEE